MHTLTKLGGKLLAAISILATLCACGGPAKVYPVTPDAAKTALVGSSVPDMAFGMAAHCEPATATDAGVAWSIQRSTSDEAGTSDSSGQEIMVLTATLVPSDRGTQVTVGIEPPAGGSPDGVKKLDEQKPRIADLWRSIAREQVDAVLAHHDFQFASTQVDLAVAVASELPNISKQAEEAVDEDHRKEVERIHEAYRAAGSES